MEIIVPSLISMVIPAFILQYHLKGELQIRSESLNKLGQIEHLIYDILENKNIILGIIFKRSKKVEATCLSSCIYIEMRVAKNECSSAKFLNLRNKVLFLIFIVTYPVVEKGKLKNLKRI